MLVHVHELALMPRELVMPPSDGGGGATARSTRINERWCVEPCLETGRPGSVPFVSDRPGAYGRLLLVVYVRWRTGVLVPSDWLRTVTRAAGEPASWNVCAVWLTSAD